MAAANQMNGEIHDGRRHCSVYPSFAIFSIQDKEMEEKLQCHKDVTFGLQEESISESGAAEGMGQTHQQGTL